MMLHMATRLAPALVGGVNLQQCKYPRFCDHRLVQNSRDYIVNSSSRSLCLARLAVACMERYICQNGLYCMTEISVQSPCIRACQLDSSGTLCLGCYRSREEIGEWSGASDGRKHEIIEKARKRALNGKGRLTASDRPGVI